MNNKCLVTQLKASCTEMENPIYFGKAEMLVEATSDDAILHFLHVNNKPVEIELIEGNSGGFSIVNLDSKSYLSKKGDKIIINKPSEEAVGDSKSNDYYPFSFKTGIYKLRYDKYSFAPYIAGANISTLIQTEDVIYREDGLYQIFSEYFNMGFAGDLSNLLKVTPSNTKYFNIKSYIDGKYYYLNGDLQEILNSLTSLSRLSLNIQSSMEGNINSFSTYAGRYNIKYVYLNNCIKMSGDIVTAFANCTSLTDLNLENLSKVTGSIAELAQAQVNNGRTSGTLLITGNAKQVVPNPGAGKTITFTESGYTIS